MVSGRSPSPGDQGSRGEFAGRCLLSARKHACRSSLMPSCAALAPWVCTPWYPRRHFARLVLAAVQGDEPLRHQLRRASAGVAEMVGGWLMVNLKEHGVDCDG